MTYFVESNERFGVNSDHSQTRSVASEELGKKPNKYCTYFFILQTKKIYSYIYKQFKLSKDKIYICWSNINKLIYSIGFQVFDILLPMNKHLL